MTRSFTGPNEPRIAARPLSTAALPRRACALLALAALGALCAVACTAGEPPAQPGPGAGGGPGAAFSPPRPAPARLPAPLARQCRETCSTATDCAEPGASALADASHFTCTNNRCGYTGCQTSAECASIYGPAFVCEVPPGASIRGCVPTCSTAADCADPSGPSLVDASHFACPNNRCEYTGCRTTAECAEAYGPGSVCQAIPGLPIKDCVPSCSTPADCAAPDAPSLFDASHFECTAARCEHLGCKSNAECTAVNGPGWVCE